MDERLIKAAFEELVVDQVVDVTVVVFILVTSTTVRAKSGTPSQRMPAETTVTLRLPCHGCMALDLRLNDLPFEPRDSFLVLLH